MNANTDTVLRAMFGARSGKDRSKLESNLAAIVDEHGLDAVLDGLIAVSGLDKIRAILKTRKKTPGRKKSNYVKRPVHDPRRTPAT